jgi:hypothetical protein
MKRLLTSAVAAAFLMGGAAVADAEAQVDRRASAFDLGLYAGGAVTSAWFDEADGTPWRIGGAPIFGGQATWWLAPSWGIRLHYGNMKSPFPEPDRGLFDFSEWSPPTGTDDGRPINTHLYDLGLAFRPWIADPGAGNFLASTYFFLGAGGLTADIAGFNERRTTTATPGVYFSRSPSEATVGQGTVGAGFTLFPITPGIGVFGELAVHGYSAPVHTGDGWNQARQQHQANVPEGTDHFAFTTRGVLGLAFAFGDLMPPPPPPPVEPPPPPPPPPPAEREMEICVIDDQGNIQVVDAIFLPETGDTMVVVDGQRRAFATVYPTDARYAAGQRWFVDNEPIHVMDQRYVKTGLPRIIQPQELTRVGEYQGVSVFAQPGAETPPAVIYLPVRPGCEFQAYQAEEEVIRVRG